MPIVTMNPRSELSEFYPPPYDFLGPKKCAACGRSHAGAYRTKQLGMGSQQSLQQGLAIGATAANAIPVVGQAVSALLTLTGEIASFFQGCGSSCVLAAANANKVEPLLQQNLQAYLAQPVHYQSVQTAALNNFNTVWNALVQACSDPSLGAAGQRCISDRQQGSCAYKTSPGGWSNGKYTYPGANGSGSTCWNWFVGYHDPIVNDPTVVPDQTAASTVSSVVGNILGQQTASGQPAPSGTVLSAGNLSGLLIPAGLIGIALLFMMGGSK
jgi:hypothetical protein